LRHCGSRRWLCTAFPSIDRALIIITGIVIVTHAFELKSQLSFLLLCSFNLGALSRKAGLLLLSLFLGSLATLLLLSLFELACLDLLL
jgi:hypothetical protein